MRCRTAIFICICLIEHWSKSALNYQTCQTWRLICWIIWSQSTLTANHQQHRARLPLYFFHQGPSAVKLQHASLSPDQKNPLQWWHTQYNKQPSDSAGKVWSKKTEPVRASELHTGNTMHEQASCRSLLSLLWLTFRQREAPLDNACWQSSCLTNLCFDSAHCVQRTAFLFFLF